MNQPSTSNQNDQHSQYDNEEEEKRSFPKSTFYNLRQIDIKKNYDIESIMDYANQEQNLFDINQSPPTTHQNPTPSLKDLSKSKNNTESKNTSG